MTSTIPIIEAAKAGDAAAVAALLDQEPATVHVRCEDGYPPLYWAALYGCSGRTQRSRPVVELLLARGAEIDIFAAAYLDRPDRTAELLATDPGLAHSRDRSAMTPLHHSAERGALEVARLLVRARANVNARDRRGRTPLHYSSHPGPWKPAPAAEISELLRTHGAEIDVFLAASLGDTARLVKMLDRRPPLVHATDRSGSTALFHAARGRHGQAIELLLARGADVNARRDDGLTPISAAIAHIAEPDGPETVQLLLDRGAELDLFDACAVGKPDRVAALLAADPTGAHTERWGQTPQQAAAMGGHVAILALLEQAGIRGDR